MRWSTFFWFVLVIAVVALNARAAPAPRNEDNMFRELLRLDQMYSSIARPSLRSDPVQDEARPKMVHRAMLRLQELDRIYADRARPRFGKRTESNTNMLPSEYEDQYQSEDFGDWLPARR